MMHPSSLNIGVIGAGNIGTAMATLLSQSGARVWLTARGQRLTEIRRSGVTLNDRGQVISARPEPCEAITRPMDALFVCVKSQSLAGAVHINRAAITPKTLVIPMVNGLPFWFYADRSGMGDVPHLDPDGALSRLLRPEQVLGAVLLMTVRMDEAGCAYSSNTPTLSLGLAAKDGGADQDRLDALLDTLEKSGVATDFCPDIRQKVLVKLLANFATNPLSALSGAMLDEIGKTPALCGLCTALAAEFRAWAAGEGYELPPEDWLIDLLIDAGAFPTSMLQDALAGKPLELDAICRAPMALAAQKGNEMPLLSALLAQIRAADSLPLPAEKLTAALAELSGSSARSARTTPTQIAEKTL